MSSDGWLLFKSILRWLGLAGLLAALAGLSVNGVEGLWRDWSAGLVLGGGGLALAALCLNFPDLWRYLRAPRGAIWLNVLIVTLAGGALCAMFNYLGARHDRRLADLSAGGQHAISETTRQHLRELQAPVLVYLFAPTVAATLDFNRMRYTAEEFARAAPGRFRLEALDPHKDRAAISDFLRTHQVAEEELTEEAEEGALYVVYRDRAKLLRVRDLTEFDELNQQKLFRGEEELWAAVLAITSNQRDVLYFVIGHGEPSLGDYEPPGLGQFARILERSNFTLRELGLAAADAVPDDCAALIEIGPRAPWSAHEARLLGEYLKRGGRFLLCVDPPVFKNIGVASTGLEELLARRYDITLEDNLVYDPETCRNMEAMPFPVLGVDRGSHPVGDSNRTVGTPLFPLAREVRPRARRAGVEPVDVATIISSAPENVWAEQDYHQPGKFALNPDAGDHAGPIILGLGARARLMAPMTERDLTPEQRWRIIVFGSASFCQNYFLRQTGVDTAQHASQIFHANADLLRNSVLWLTERESEMGINPISTDYRRFQLTRRQWLAGTLVYFLAGLLVIAAGVVVWLLRK